MSDIYEAPEAGIIMIDAADVIATSGDRDSEIDGGED